MLPKPPACAGCPFLDNGLGFVPDELVPTAEVMVVAQNPGADEEAGRQLVGWAGRRQPLYEPHPPAPLIGATGYELEHTYFPVAGLTRGDNVSLGNVLKCRWTVNGRRVNDLPTGKVLAQATECCTTAHFRVPESTRLIVAMGALAARYLGMPGSISEWRGFLLP